MVSKLLLGWAVIWIIAVAAGPARADWCETFPGSQTYTSQGCNNPGGSPTRAENTGKTALQPHETGLRERLRRALNQDAADRANRRASAGALANAVSNARADVKRALDRATTAFDAPRLEQSRREYEAAMTRLNRAYDAAISAASDAGADDLRDMKSQAQAEFGDQAKQAGLYAAPGSPQAQAPQPEPAKPANITAADGLVYVCDGPVAGRNTSCREISADGSQCVSVTLSDGVVGWRDSIATPCQRDDQARRAAFLAANPAAAKAAAEAPTTFGMDRAGTEAEVLRLTADAFSTMSEACRTLLSGYLEATTANDRQQAAKSFADLGKQCGELMDPLAAKAGTGLPQRTLTSGARTLLQRAMQNDPGSVPGTAARVAQGETFDGYDVAEVVSFGMDLLSAFGGIGGARAVLRGRAIARPAVPSGGAVRAASPQIPVATSCGYTGCFTTNGLRPATNQSTITGIGTR